MMSATSESLLYADLFLPGDELATPAALTKLWRTDLRESGQLAYGLQSLDNPNALALNPQHLPLHREAFSLGPRLATHVKGRASRRMGVARRLAGTRRPDSGRPGAAAAHKKAAYHVD